MCASISVDLWVQAIICVGEVSVCVCVCVFLGPCLNFLSRLWPGPYRRDNRSGTGHSNRRHPGTWLDGAGSGGSLLPTDGQVVVRTGVGGGGSRWFRLSLRYTHINWSDTLINMSYRCTHTHTHTSSVTVNNESQTRFFTHTHTHVQWPCGDRAGSLFCVISLDLPVGLPDPTCIYTPSCVCVCVCVFVRLCGHSVVKPKSWDP